MASLVSLSRVAGVAIATACMVAPAGCAPSSPARVPGARAPSTVSGRAETTSDPLTALNETARAAYAAARTRALTNMGPVIIVEGDKLVLLRGALRTEIEVIPPEFHVLKAIAHIPLGLFATLSAPDSTLDDTRAKTLSALRERIVAARASLATRQPPAPERQQQIISESLALIDRTLSSQRIQHAEVAAYARRLGPLLLENAADAARMQLDSIHARVGAWRREMSPAEWEALRVVVIGSHMARQSETAMQYFGRLLHETNEGHRVVFAEGLWEEPRALEMLATHVLDERVAEGFFADPMRLHRDLLGDAATEYVRSLLPD